MKRKLWLLNAVAKFDIIEKASIPAPDQLEQSLALGTVTPTSNSLPLYKYLQIAVFCLAVASDQPSD